MKAAVIHYIAGLAFDLAPKGVRANVVSPGNVYFDGGVWQNIERNNPDLFEASVALNPTGRLGTPEETAYAVVMLASPRASRIVGRTSSSTAHSPAACSSDHRPQRGRTARSSRPSGPRREQPDPHEHRSGGVTRGGVEPPTFRFQARTPPQVSA